MRKATKCASGYGSNSQGFSCGVCQHFGDNSCELVEGIISPSSCCNLFDSPTFRAACKCRRARR